jgi:hypothetical protein
VNRGPGFDGPAWVAGHRFHLRDSDPAWVGMISRC